MLYKTLNHVNRLKNGNLTKHKDIYMGYIFTIGLRKWKCQITQ